MKKYLPLLLIVSFLSCKKEDIDNTPVLLSKSWRMTEWTVLTPLSGTPLDGTSQNWMGANLCVTEKIQTFKLDGTFIHEKTTTCVNDNDFTGLWTLSDNNKVVNVNYVGGGYVNFKYNIVEITTSNLKVQRLQRTGVGGSQFMDLLMQYVFEPR